MSAANGSEAFSAPGVDAAAAARLHLRGPDRGFAIGAVSVLGLAAAHGGYFATSWGWTIVGFAVVGAWALAGRPTHPSRFQAMFIVGLVSLTAWCALSSLWGTTADSLMATHHMLVYTCAMSAIALSCSSRHARSLLAGVVCAIDIVATYALVTRLFPRGFGEFDPIAGYRLGTPIGYWNGLGLFCVLGILGAIALATSAESPWLAALAAAPTPALAATLYFTFGRGAWIALAAGATVSIVLDARRLALSATMVAVGLPAGLCVFVASRAGGLTHETATAVQATSDGRHFALVVVLLVVLAGALVFGAIELRRHVSSPRWLAKTYTAGLAVSATILICGCVLHFGGPTATARSIWRSFASPPPQVAGDLGKRLFSFSGTGRIDLWRTALRDFESHPLLGSGAGSYESYWLQHRGTPLKVRNAHSLYLETLAELGVPGLAFLVCALLAPFLGGIRARRRPGSAAATGVYVAYLVGAGADWDWQLTSVTLAALIVGMGILIPSRLAASQRGMPPRLRRSLLTATVAVGITGFVFLVGNMLLSRSEAAAMAGNQAAAESYARRASAWLPWSTSTWQQRGEAQLAQGETSGAQAAFRNAIRKDSGDWNLWLDLARASTGKVQQQALARAKQLNPLSPEIREFENELGSAGGISLGVAK